MDLPVILVLGCGFAGSRVAKRFCAAGYSVFCAGRSARAPDGCRGIEFDVTRPETASALGRIVPRGALVLQSIPLIESAGIFVDPTPFAVEALRPVKPARVVSLSTTGVYGAATHVDETTEPAPRTRRECLRLDGERAITAGPWSSLILRPAAIYGPFRGIHASMRAGKFRVPASGGGAISRISVDDLADHVVAAMQSSLTGAFPVADERPCSSMEVAAFCSKLLGIPMAEFASIEALPETLQGDRRVDGQAIRTALGLKLRYPTYVEGIRAAIAEEDGGNPNGDGSIGIGR